MEHKQNPARFEGPADESASPSNPLSGSAASAEPPPAFSDSLDAALGATLDATFAPGGRKPRHDGWTPEAVAIFLRHLAANGIVDHAARAAGRSAASAYAFRNRRQGRAFAKMWDAVLVHRSRARLASDMQARALAGCVSLRKREGEVVGEHHYHDNRLAMSLLTRLDRLAEKEAAEDAQLRALSEDLDEFIDCLASGGDADAFVEARKPAEPVASADEEPDDDPELTLFARVAGCPDYRNVDPFDIEVLDLDPAMRSDWSPDQWVRAWRSGFMIWREIGLENPDWTDGPGTPVRFWLKRRAARAAAATEDGAGPTAEGETVDTSDLDPETILDWTQDQLARAWRSGFLATLAAEFWDDLAADLPSPGRGW
ncbi:MAG: hypothetical protein ACFBQW_03370 [Sphingomonadaceae bacterium]